jgi:hypothetical protein
MNKNVSRPPNASNSPQTGGGLPRLIASSARAWHAEESDSRRGVGLVCEP